MSTWISERVALTDAGRASGFAERSGAALAAGDHCARWTRIPGLLVLVLVLLLVLAGCFENAALERAASRVGLAASGPEAVSVLDGAVTVAGPDAYCIDDEATREGQAQAFVLLARCRTSRRPSPVLSATVSGHAAPGGGSREALQQLADFLATPTGRAQLSRSGEATDVRIDEVLLQDGALWLRIHDEGNPDTLQPGYWRAIMPLSERVVTLSVMSARAHPVGSQAELQALRDFVASMRAANAG